MQNVLFDRLPTQRFILNGIKRAVIIGVLLSLTALLVFCPKVFSTDSAGINTAAKIASTQSTKLGLAYRFTSGKRLVYRLEYESFAISDLQVLFEGMDSTQSGGQVVQSGLAQSFKTALKAELALTVLSQKANEVSAAYRFHQPEVILYANSQEAITQAEIFKDALSRFIFVHISFDGRIKSLWLDPEIGDPSHHFARTLLALVQFVLPSNQTPQSHKWKVQEDDPSGQYIAQYEAEPSADESDTKKSKNAVKSFRKTKLYYLSPQPKPLSNKSQIPAEFIPKGSLICQFDVEWGHLISLSGSETQRIFMAGKEVGRADTTLKLYFSRKETLAKEDLEALRNVATSRQKNSTPVALWVDVPEKKREKIIQRSELGQASLKSLLTDLATAQAEGKKNDTPLYLKFKALIYLHPEVSASLGKLLITADPQSLTIRTLSDALGTVGHPQAQAALVNAIYARSDEPAAVLTLVKSLGSVDTPTKEAEKTLHDLATHSRNWNIFSTAALTLGIMARRINESSPERAARIVDWAKRELQAATTEDRRRLYLLSLGNAGTVQTLPAIAKYVDDPSPAVRSSAASALRLIDSNEADDLLTKFLLSDPAQKVRLEAAFSFSFRELTPDTFDVHKKAFFEDTAVIVRLAALENLWNVHETFPEVRKIVKQAAQNDPVKEVRKAANDIIAMYPEDYFKE